MLQLFAPLPYSLAPAIACRNEQRFFAMHKVAPENASYSRMFPSGSLGVNLTKPLHDDKNGVVCPGLWQSIQEDPENIVDMKFFTNVCTWSYQSTTHRFAWFHGIVPHKSELRRSHVVSSSTRRMHHSSYIKLDHEQLALVTMSNDKLDQLCVVAATSGEC